MQWQDEADTWHGGWDYLHRRSDLGSAAKRWLGWRNPKAGLGAAGGGTGALSGDARWVAEGDFPLVPSAGAGIRVVLFFLPGPGCRMQPWEIGIRPVPVSSSCEQCRLIQQTSLSPKRAFF